MESIWCNVKINILLALTNETWQLEVMSNINEQNQLKIKRRCVDSVDLMSAIHLGLANKIVVSPDFPNLNIETIVKDWMTATEIGMGKIMQPFRLSLVGALKGPHLFNIVELIGKEETIKRLEKAIATL